MTYHPMLPFGVLIIAIYAVSWLRNVLGSYAMFRSQNSPLRPAERIVRGFQIAMIVLFMVGAVSTGWNIRPVLLQVLEESSMKEPPHITTSTTSTPVLPSVDDPPWLAHEKMNPNSSRD